MLYSFYIHTTVYPTISLLHVRIFVVYPLHQYINYIFMLCPMYTLCIYSVYIHVLSNAISTFIVSMLCSTTTIYPCYIHVIYPYYILTISILYHIIFIRYPYYFHIITIWESTSRNRKIKNYGI